ncbi:hypothetical protein HDU98_007609 [Podochytrium sp. JEL0797]|nr:hypothetical protein HDU98_007609 [Podochytrium sp. JEL0797]
MHYIDTSDFATHSGPSPYAQASDSPRSLPPTFASALANYQHDVNPEAVLVPPSEQDSGVDAPVVVEVPPLVTRGFVVSTLLGTLPIRYEHPENQYFLIQRPDELEGLISTQEFHSRMQHVNEKLAKLWTLKDYTPLVRTVSLSLVVLGILLSLLVNYALTGLIGLVFVVLLATYFKNGAVHNLLSAELNTFNKTDKHIKLKWTLLPKFHQNERPVFATSRATAAFLVPWRIQVQQISKDGDEESVEFLPAYMPAFSGHLSARRGSAFTVASFDLIGGVVGVSRPPSYMTMAPL